MFLSRLTLDLRCARARKDLNAHYEMHRTLLRAFPDRDSGGAGHVLFRVEPLRDDSAPVVLVQSDCQPDWKPLVETRYARVEGPRTVSFTAESSPGADPNTVLIRPGDHFRFRLLANPTVKREGKRHGLLQESQQIEWFERKAEAGGFECELFDLEVAPVGRYQSFRNQGSARAKVTHQAVRFEGVLRVTDTERFIESIQSGIGSAKAFGFGLLSLARV